MIYFRKKLLAVMLLGIASGLPLLLVGGTLGARLQDAGLDKGEIGLFALVALPYSFNFVWAPFIDRLRLPFFTASLGRRRGWLLCIQLILLLSLVALAMFNPSTEITLVAFAALALAFLSASQDVVIDAYRTEYLDEPEYAAGAAMVVFGYRLGMLGAGAGALALADSINWQVAYLVMAGIMALAMIVTLFLPEPENPLFEEYAQGQTVMSWLKKAFVEPFADFMQRYPSWWLILLLVFTFRLPDGLIGFMTTPFFLDIGFTKSEVAAIAKLYGFGATLLGMFVGGWMVSRYGIARCMLWFMLLQICTNLTYVLLSEAGPQRELLMLSIACDNMSGGMITCVAVAYIMGLCNKAFTATQYALLSSLASLASKSIAAGAGFIAEAVGWTGLFTISAAAGIPALVLMVVFRAKLYRHQTVMK